MGFHSQNTVCQPSVQPLVAPEVTLLRHPQAQNRWLLIIIANMNCYPLLLLLLFFFLFPGTILTVFYARISFNPCPNPTGYHCEPILQMGPWRQRVGRLSASFYSSQGAMNIPFPLSAADIPVPQLVLMSQRLGKSRLELTPKMDLGKSKGCGLAPGLVLFIRPEAISFLCFLDMLQIFYKKASFLEINIIKMNSYN